MSLHGSLKALKKFRNGAMLATSTTKLTMESELQEETNSNYESECISMPQRHEDASSSRLSTPELLRHAITVMTIKVGRTEVRSGARGNAITALFGQVGLAQTRVCFLYFEFVVGIHYWTKCSGAQCNVYNHEYQPVPITNDDECAHRYCAKLFTGTFFFLLYNRPITLFIWKMVERERFRAVGYCFLRSSNFHQEIWTR